MLTSLHHVSDDQICTIGTNLAGNKLFQNDPNTGDDAPVLGMRASSSTQTTGRNGSSFSPFPTASPLSSGYNIVDSVPVISPAPATGDYPWNKSSNLDHDTDQLSPLVLESSSSQESRSKTATPSIGRINNYSQTELSNLNPNASQLSSRMPTSSPPFSQWSEGRTPPYSSKISVFEPHSQFPTASPTSSSLKSVDSKSRFNSAPTTNNSFWAEPADPVRSSSQLSPLVLTAPLLPYHRIEIHTPRPSSETIIEGPHSLDWEITDFPEALHGLRRVYGNQAHFKSRAQAELIQAVLLNQEGVFCIIKTGGGKSAAWEVAGMVDNGSVTVVVVPTRELLAQHDRKTRALGIECMHYTTNDGNNIGTCSVLFMAVETVLSDGFRRWAALYSQVE